MLLDYSSFITNWLKPDFQNDRSKLFFSRQGFCRFCNQEIPVVGNRGGYVKGEVWPEEGGEYYVGAKAWCCPMCGWWDARTYRETRIPDEQVVFEDVEIHNAILREYDLAATDVPIRTLRKEIQKHPDLLYQIHTERMEKVVQSVFKDHYLCEVEHVGRSHDGGIDLVLVNSDQPALVQIKRRESATAVESVSSVREFLGAVLLERGVDTTGAIFVTTADHFSREAHKAARRAVTNELVRSYELVAAKRFVEMMSLTRSKVEEPWAKLVNDAR